MLDLYHHHDFTIFDLKRDCYNHLGPHWSHNKDPFIQPRRNNADGFSAISISRSSSDDNGIMISFHDVIIQSIHFDGERIRHGSQYRKLDYHLVYHVIRFRIPILAPLSWAKWTFWGRDANHQYWIIWSHDTVPCLREHYSQATLRGRKGMVLLLRRNIICFMTS